MAGSTLEKLLRIQSSAEPTSSNTTDAGAHRVPASPPGRRSSHTGRGISPYSKQFRVAFDFLQRYTNNPPRTVDDWSAVCDDMTRIANENENDGLLMDLLVAAWIQIERVYKGEAATKP